MSEEVQATEVIPKTYSYVFNPYREPIARVKPEERVTIHTNDAFESRITKKEHLPSRALATAKFLNPQTGPIYVEGAEPGDTLAVHIESIQPTRDFAVSVLIPYFGGLTSTNVTRTLQEPLPERVWIWNLVDGGNKLVNEELGVELAWEPFLGTLAVAPELEAITALAPGPFGGNMDVPDVKPGNTIYLPVWNEGALFYTGYCHARQEQVERCGVALEITSKVTVVFEGEKMKAVPSST
jgi:amidase